MRNSKSFRASSETTGTSNIMRKLILTIATVIGALSTAVVSANKESVKLELQHFWVSPGENQALEQIVSHAQKAGLELDIYGNKNYNTLRENISERISLGYLPEVSHWIAGEDFSSIVSSNTLLEVPDKLNGVLTKDIVHPEVMESLAMDGKLLALPVGIHLQEIAIYNMKLLESVGVSSTPQTWPEYFGMADKLQEKSILPIAMSDVFWITRELLHGVLISLEQKQAMYDIYGEFDSRGVLLENLRKSFKILFALRNYAAADEGVEGRNWSDAVRMVVEGEAASVFMGDFARSEIAYYAGSNLSDIKCAAVPGLRAAHYGIDIFVLFDNQNDHWRQNAESFAAVVLDPRTQSDYLYYKGGLPVIQNIKPENLNQCSKVSFSIWNDDPSQRFSLPGVRDNDRIAVLHVVLPEIWADTSLTADAAADRLYKALKPTD